MSWAEPFLNTDITVIILKQFGYILSLIQILEGLTRGAIKIFLRNLIIFVFRS